MLRCFSTRPLINSSRMLPVQIRPPKTENAEPPNLKMPKLQDFEITAEEFTYYKTGHSVHGSHGNGFAFSGRDWNSFAAFCGTVVIFSISIFLASIATYFAFMDSDEVGKALVTSILTLLVSVFVAYALTCCVLALVDSYKYSRWMNGPIGVRIRRYEEAEQAYLEGIYIAEQARRERERVSRKARREVERIAEEKRQEAERAAQEKRQAEARIAQEERRKAELARQEAERIAEEKRRKAEKARLEAERVAQEERLAAERSIRKKKETYWTSLDGIEFERELADLFRDLGYEVESTPVSGDQGIDLVLKRKNRTTVVQCKAHKRPIGPAVVRELYGAMVAARADHAALVCTGGFTKGVRDFAENKPITLLQTRDIVALCDRVSENDPDSLRINESIDTPPNCPEHDCGELMIMREGKLSSFWGCPRFPGLQRYPAD